MALARLIPVKKNAFLALALLTAASPLAGRAEAASAVAIDPKFHITRAYDPFASEEAAKQRALELAVQHSWLGARIVASTGRSGYCAIALGRNAVIGISLADPSQAEADRRAIANCLKGGGIDPKAYSRFKG
jgi:hypothetical protein